MASANIHDYIAPGRRAHLVGIGGVSMSPLAEVLHKAGMVITGSDMRNSATVEHLRALGIPVAIGHRGENVQGAELVIRTAAVHDENPEIAAARAAGIPVFERAQAWGAIMRGYKNALCIAGTHGKTTTTSMCTHIIMAARMDPTVMIGGTLPLLGSGYRVGHGDTIILESCEYCNSFLSFFPTVAVILNIEADHLDHYGTLENIEKTFCTFMGLVGEKGTVVVNGDNPHYVELARSTGRHVVTYGFDKGNDYVCTPEEGLAPHRLAMRFSVKTPSGASVDVTIKSNPGRHNMANATAAIAVADVLGADVSQAAEKLSEFKGARRRFTHVGDIDGVTVVDDYGHHPTEIAATLDAASQLGFDRIVCVFQPHRYSRTKALEPLFAHAFDKVDVLRVMDVFSAGEMPIPGISGKTVSSQVEAAGTVADVAYIPNRHELIQNLCDTCRPGDLLITQGAGDVTQIGPAFIAAMHERDEKRDER